MQVNLIRSNFGQIVKSKRLSIGNFLLLIFHCSESNTILQRELLDQYLEAFKVSKKDSVVYLETHNKERMFSDLISFEEQQKALLVILAHSILNADRKPALQELNFASTFFTRIGLSEKEYEKTILMNTLMRITSKLK